MKCPKCGINYDDSDRECPMCGAPKPLFAKDKSQLAKTTAHHAGSDNKNTDYMGSILDLGSNKKSSWSKPKKNGKNIIIVVIIIILISVLSALISNINSMISNEPQNIVQVEPEPDISIDVIKLYTMDNDETQFNIFNDGTYYVVGSDFDEWGDIEIREYQVGEISEFETFLLNNGININEFTINLAIITPEDERKYIIIAESNSKIFLYDVNRDISWLDDGVLVDVRVWE